MTLQTSNDIRAAAAFIETPEKWCQGHLAIGSVGDICSPLSPRAMARCIVGAIMAACGEDWNGSRFCAAKRELDRLAEGSIVTWHDKPYRTHAEVLALLHQAAAASAYDSQESEETSGSLPRDGDIE